ncbi:MAG: hypothetical protein KAX80_13330, partial [Planctomycetes bacterium]|nr:hypothetical protein [Planctomycetota bacterium]
MVRRRRWTSVLAATLFLVLALSNGVRAAGDLSSEVPADTFFYLEFGGFTALEEPFKQTAMYAIWQEPEVQALLQEPLGSFKARIESGESNWPLLWAEVRDFLDGPMALAVLPSAEEGAEPGLIVVARPADGEKFRSALAKLIESGKEGRLERAFE